MNNGENMVYDYQNKGFSNTFMDAEVFYEKRSKSVIKRREELMRKKEEMNRTKIEAKYQKIEQLK